MEKRLLTVKESAAYTGYSVSAVRRLIASGELPDIRNGRYGRAIRIDRLVLDEFIANGGTMPAKVVRIDSKPGGRAA